MLFVIYLVSDPVSESESEAEAESESESDSEPIRSPESESESESEQPHHDSAPLAVALAKLAIPGPVSGWMGRTIGIFPYALTRENSVAVRHGLVMYECSQILHRSIIYQKEQIYHLA